MSRVEYHEVEFTELLTCWIEDQRRKGKLKEKMTVNISDLLSTETGGWLNRSEVVTGLQLTVTYPE